MSHPRINTASLSFRNQLTYRYGGRLGTRLFRCFYEATLSSTLDIYRMGEDEKLARNKDMLSDFLLGQGRTELRRLWRGCNIHEFAAVVMEMSRLLSFRSFLSMSAFPAIGRERLYTVVYLRNGSQAVATSPGELGGVMSVSKSEIEFWSKLFERGEEKSWGKCEEKDSKFHRMLFSGRCTVCARAALLGKANSPCYVYVILDHEENIGFDENNPRYKKITRPSSGRRAHECWPLDHRIEKSISWGSQCAAAIGEKGEKGFILMGYRDMSAEPATTAHLELLALLGEVVAEAMARPVRTF
ncbi:MAG: hypothetical protein ABIJ26_04515 [Candidatus Margulisiibacteriota bacterium]|nr:hypothetical protein [Candidatus Margulisiibacteriota bacterium]